MTTSDALTALRAVVGKMTAGTWTTYRSGNGLHVAIPRDDFIRNPMNAEGMALLHNLAPELLAVVEAAAELHHVTRERELDGEALKAGVITREVWMDRLKPRHAAIDAAAATLDAALSALTAAVAREVKG